VHWIFSFSHGKGSKIGTLPVLFVPRKTQIKALYFRPILGMFWKNTFTASTAHAMRNSIYPLPCSLIVPPLFLRNNYRSSIKRKSGIFSIPPLVPLSFLRNECQPYPLHRDIFVPLRLAERMPFYEFLFSFYVIVFHFFPFSILPYSFLQKTLWISYYQYSLFLFFGSAGCFYCFGNPLPRPGRFIPAPGNAFTNPSTPKTSSSQFRSSSFRGTSASTNYELQITKKSKIFNQLVPDSLPGKSKIPFFWYNLRLH
jgi:hypothetical protein